MSANGLVRPKRIMLLAVSGSGGAICMAGGKSILLVEDDDALRDSLVEQLKLYEAHRRGPTPISSPVIIR